MRRYSNEDMNLYSYEGDDILALPEKTKQVGALEDKLRIYIEDYVYTYLYQYGKSDGGKEKVAALVGRHIRLNDEEAVIICGAIQGKHSVFKNGIECFSEKTWEYIGSQMETYFKGMSLIGWVHLQPSFGSFLMAKDELFHIECFKEDWQVLFVIDTLDKMDTFYVKNNDGNGLRQAKGYFVYYDKNREMQEYMLDNTVIRPRTEETIPNEDDKSGAEEAPLKRRPTPEERIDAAKEIRRVLKKRAEEAEESQKGRYRMLTGISCALCMVCLCMGFALMSNMNRLKSLEGEITMVQAYYEELEENLEGVRVQAAFAAESTTTEDTAPKEETAVEVKEPEEGKKYTVEAGDSLGFISRMFYGSNDGIKRIMEANNIENANMIYEGQELLIP